jgi:hypothetical protein
MEDSIADVEGAYLDVAIVIASDIVTTRTGKYRTTA